MYVECNLPIDLEDKDHVDKILKSATFLKNLGWDGVVLNVTISKTNFAKMDSYLDAMPVLVDKLISKWDVYQIENNKQTKSNNVHFISPLKISEQYPIEFKFYKRITVIENFDQFSRLNFDNTKFRQVDIIAVVPLSMTQLENVTSKMNIDMISFQYGGEMGNPQKTIIQSGSRRLVETMKRGIAFEISYAEAFKQRTLFYEFITRLTDLIRLTKSHNLILSNGSDQIIHMRSPHDIANIPALLGIDHSLGKKMISNHVRMALVHGEQRMTIKGVMQVLEEEQPSCEKNVKPTGEGTSKKRTHDKL